MPIALCAKRSSLANLKLRIYPRRSIASILEPTFVRSSGLGFSGLICLRGIVEPPAFFGLWSHFQNCERGAGFSLIERGKRGIRVRVGHGVSATNHLLKSEREHASARDSIGRMGPHSRLSFPDAAGGGGAAHRQAQAARPTVLEVARIEVFVRTWAGLPGRPLSDRHALARAFIAKAVLGLPTTSALIERLAVGILPRAGFADGSAEAKCRKSTFSRAFAEFAETELPARAHEAICKRLR